MGSTRPLGRIALGAAVLAAGGAAVWIGFARTPEAPPAPRAAPPPVSAPLAPEPSDGPPEPPPLDRSAHSTTDPRSIWVIVNKTHAIAPLEFRPAMSLVRGYQVATAAVRPLTRLLADADRLGLGLKIESAFRSYAYQVGVHDDLVATSGLAAADRVSARAGYSEHQTGLAVDVITPADPGCDLDPCFARTRAGRWLARNAWRYGFIVRYPPGEAAVTGYSPEPWHLRYVGRPLAAELRRTGIATLEEFFGVRGGDYPHR